MANQIIITNLIWLIGASVGFASMLLLIGFILETNPKLLKWLNNSIFGLGDID